MKKYIPLARKLPKSVRDTSIKLLNPLRKRNAFKYKMPLWITFFVTNYCSARCEHCFYWSELNNREEEMTSEQIGTFLSTLNSKLSTLRLSGGEPFLKKEKIIGISDVLNEQGIADKLSIPTHGMLEIIPTIDRMLEKQKDVHLNVSISLDGLQERHDETRKIRNGFDRACENLRSLVEREKSVEKFNISVSISLARQIVFPSKKGATSELEELISFLRHDIGVKSIGYDHIRSSSTDVYDLPKGINSNFQPPPDTDEDPNNRHKREGDVQLDIDEMIKVNERLEKFEGEQMDRLTILRLRKQVETKVQKRRIVDCVSGYKDAVVYPQGNVSLCEFTKPFANLKSFNFDFQKLWQSKQADDYRRLTKKCACTHPCSLGDSLAYDSEFLVEYLN